MQIEDVEEEIGGTNRWALHRWPLVIGIYNRVWAERI